MGRYILVLLAIFLLIGCVQGDEAIADNSLSSITFKGTSGIEVKPLDHEDNPYRDTYREWDEWIFNHACSKPIASEGGTQPETWKVLAGYINDEGYLIPCAEYVRLREEAWKTGTIDEFFEQHFQIFGEGELPGEIEEGLHTCEDEISASFYPAIPDWLAAAPPKAAMLLPDGNVATQGPLPYGSMQDDDGALVELMPSVEPLDYYLYSPEGVELNHVPARAAWWLLYYDSDKRGWPDGDLANRRDGYFYFEDCQTGDVLGYYDYDGSLLDSTEPPPFRDAHNFIWLPDHRLTVYYEYQCN